MEKLTETIEAGTTWEEIGLPQLYGSVSVGTPTRPNPIPAICRRAFGQYPSAAAWRTKAIWRRSCPGCKIFFRSWGIWKAPSSDLFGQFLKTGMGAKPLIAGYENQLLEFAVENPDTWEQIKGDIVIMYPTPPSGPPMCISPWMRPVRRGSMPCWMRTSSGWPGKSTGSVLVYTIPPRMQPVSGCPVLPRN